MPVLYDGSSRVKLRAKVVAVPVMRYHQTNPAVMLACARSYPARRCGGGAPKTDASTISAVQQPKKVPVPALSLLDIKSGAK